MGSTQNKTDVVDKEVAFNLGSRSSNELPAATTNTTVPPDSKEDYYNKVNGYYPDIEESSFEECRQLFDIAFDQGF